MLDLFIVVCWFATGECSVYQRNDEPFYTKVECDAQARIDEQSDEIKKLQASREGGGMMKAACIMKPEQKA